MKVLDPGHRYLLASLDGPDDVELRFVKRDSPSAKYPGNVGSHPGPTTQEVLRALIDRTKYVDRQDFDVANNTVIDLLRSAIAVLEARAARRRGQRLSAASFPGRIEEAEVCLHCGHLRCEEMCLKKEKSC